MTRGVVAAGDPQTAEAGAAVLRAGGNAIDAVIAAAFAAFVAELPLCSPAGGGVLLYGSPEHGFSVLDAFAAVPGLGLRGPAQPEDFHAVTVDFGPATQVFHVGRGAAAVPSALFGLLEAHRTGATLPLSELVAPAVALGRQGYVLGDRVQWVFDLLEPIAMLTEGTRRLFCRDGALAQPGARLDNPALADFLEALADEGEDLLRGRFTDAVVAGFGTQAGGLITCEDLHAYRPIRRPPLRVSHGPHVVLGCPPPASGGALIGLGLRLAEASRLGRHPFLGPEHLTDLAQVLSVLSQVRRGGFDEHIHEPGAAEALLDDDAVQRFRDQAGLRPPESLLGSTTHISVVDDHGCAAALTISNGEGCGYVLEELGIHVNNFLGEEDINPLGFHRLAAGTRMTTMMSPTIVLEGDSPCLVLGSGGSNRIRSAILQVLLGALSFGVPLHRAVLAPRLHLEGRHLWFEEPGLTEAAMDALARDWPDHTRFPSTNIFFGGVHVASRDGDELSGAGDPRRAGSVAIAG